MQFAVLVGSKHFGKHADAVVDLGGQVAQELEATRVRGEQSKLHEDTTEWKGKYGSKPSLRIEG